MSSIQPLRVAMLGSGLFAKEAHLPAIAELKQVVHLQANWSRSESSAQDFQSCAKKEHAIESQVHYGDEGLDTLLSREDIDAVIMALPITSQPDLITKCLKAGKHVLSEKPVADTVKRARQLIKEYEGEYKGQGLVWEVAEQFYHEPRYQRVREILDSGKLGKVHFFQQSVFIHMKEGSKYHSTSWRTIPEYQGGFLLDGGVHFAAGLAAMFGPISSVTGSSYLHWQHLAPTDTCYAICKTESGIDGTMTISMGAGPTLSKVETIISCEKGHLELLAGPDSAGGWKLTLHSPGSEPVVEMFPSRGVFHEIKAFAESVQAVKSGQAKAASKTIHKALKDLGLIESCVNDSNTWTELDSMR
ncbi:NAD(P)-binding protein [Cystobasidium minutum MCA 4210]|uniref:NAD(P)-binding protein n=1 Tax=Cystobasidium minutum MCA 4210 TaxID=1397322 RepID=UPI0034CE5C8F|eukprot:jgi/Rhomi1/20372/CE20371_5921